jgi:2-polyprenyl-6-methoxyphenol hydroxylase-like FAD-dependent oxidoreductase
VSLFLGCELARRGLRPRIIDRRPGPDQLSKAVGLHARTLEIFEELGLTDTVVNEGVRIHTLDVREGPALRAQLDFGLADSGTHTQLTFRSIAPRRFFVTSCADSASTSSGVSS